MSFGSRLKAARLARGWQQRKLAVKSGITQQSICRYESEEYEPTLRVAIRLSGALGMSLDELARDEIDEIKRETCCETPKSVSRETDGGCET